MAKESDDSRYARLLGGAIRLRREEFGISQQELAQLAKVHRNWIGRVERGQVNLTVWCLVGIASALQTSPAALLPDSDF